MAAVTSVLPVSYFAHEIDERLPIGILITFINYLLRKIWEGIKAVASGRSLMKRSERLFLKRISSGSVI